jgi:hypothetical protein
MRWLEEAHLEVLAPPPVVNTTLPLALRTFSIRFFVIQIMYEKQDINI